MSTIHRTGIFNTLTYILLLFIIPVGFAHASYQSGNYPQLAYSQLYKNGGTVNASNNIISYAIERHNVIPLRYSADFRANSQWLFNQEFFPDSYTRNKLNTPVFAQTMSKVVKEFACAEYRFRTRQPEAFGCTSDNKGRVNSTKEGMPFVSGQFKHNRLTIHQDDKLNNVSFEMYLASGSEHSLNSAFGSVHELGTFFGRLAKSDSLVLTIRLTAYTLDGAGSRTQAINSTPVIYYVILPSARQIAQHNNQRQAASYAVSHAKLLLLGKE